jgi:hypothetical protein
MWDLNKMITLEEYRKKLSEGKVCKIKFTDMGYFNDLPWYYLTQGSSKLNTVYCGQCASHFIVSNTLLLEYIWTTGRGGNTYIVVLDGTPNNQRPVIVDILYNCSTKELCDWRALGWKWSI